MGSEYKVNSIKALSRKSRYKEAEELLKRIAKEVEPIMFKYKWSVRTLREFSPKNGSVLGMNVGRFEIRIRLRLPTNQSVFYPYEDLLGTMLHELCHMKYGNHSADFYELLDRLREELEGVMTGRAKIPFFQSGCGNCLGGKMARGKTSLRNARLQSLEKRARNRVLGLNTGGRRLGYGSSERSSSSGSHGDEPTRDRLLRAVLRRCPPARDASAAAGVIMIANEARDRHQRVRRKRKTRSGCRDDPSMANASRRSGSKKVVGVIDLTMEP
eukprot:g1370.t1